MLDKAATGHGTADEAVDDARRLIEPAMIILFATIIAVPVIRSAPSRPVYSVRPT